MSIPHFPGVVFDQADDIDYLDPSDIEIVDLLETVFNMTGAEVVVRLLKFADNVRGASVIDMTEH